MDAVVEQCHQELNHLDTNATVAVGERLCPQQQHGTHHFRGERSAHPHRVGDDQVALQLLHIFRRDPHIRQLPEAGRDPVHSASLSHDLLDIGAALENARAGVIVERDGRAVACDGDDIRE